MLSSMTMTLMDGISSMKALIGIIGILVVLGLFYVFYPALSIAKTRSEVTEKVVSSLDDDDVLLSFVIPAYNEEERLPVMLDATIASISKHRKKIIQLAQTKAKWTSKSTKFEWVVVSDGSTDGTANVVEKYGRASKDADVWKVVTLHTNSGKGAAVRAGMLAARGSLRLMVDADGATEFDAILAVLEQPAPIVFGSRAHLASQAQRSFVRTMLMYAFHFCVDLLVGSNIRDTQCGFKLFTGEAADVLFSNLNLQRWAFDIELVVLANKLSMDIAEVGVSWEEVEGSKLDSSKLQLALVAIGMLRDMLCVRLCYTFGIWRIVTPTSQDKKVQ